MASRYAPLGPYLQAHPGDHIPMTFNEIEGALGFALPSSKQYPAWWSNSPTNNPMTKVWLEAGFMTEQVDTGRQKLVFRRVRRSPSTDVPVQRTREGGGLVQRLRDALGGTVTVAPGVDLSEPTGEVWDAER